MYWYREFTMSRPYTHSRDQKMVTLSSIFEKGNIQSHTSDDMRQWHRPNSILSSDICKYTKPILTHIFTQGFDQGKRVWFPSLDNLKRHFRRSTHRHLLWYWRTFFRQSHPKLEIIGKYLWLKNIPIFLQFIHSLT